MDYNKTRPLKRKVESTTEEMMEQKPGLKRTQMTRSSDMKNVDAMTASLVQELMNAATSFHKLHLQITGPGSYAAHKALNEIYDSLPELADTVAESYQGACEMLLTYEPQGPVILENVQDAIEYMRQIKAQVNDLQEVMPHSEIINELDNVKSAIDGAKYKLIFLS